VGTVVGVFVVVVVDNFGNFDFVGAVREGNFVGDLNFVVGVVVDNFVDQHFDIVVVDYHYTVMQYVVGVANRQNYILSYLDHSPFHHFVDCLPYFQPELVAQRQPINLHYHPLNYSNEILLTDCLA